MFLLVSIDVWYCPQNVGYMELHVYCKFICFTIFFKYLHPSYVALYDI